MQSSSDVFNYFKDDQKRSKKELREMSSKKKMIKFLQQQDSKFREPTSNILNDSS